MSYFDLWVTTGWSSWPHPREYILSNVPYCNSTVYYHIQNYQHDCISLRIRTWLALRPETEFVQLAFLKCSKTLIYLFSLLFKIRIRIGQSTVKTVDSVYNLLILLDKFPTFSTLIMNIKRSSVLGATDTILKMQPQILKCT